MLTATGLCWFLILALGIWQLARVFLSPGGQALLNAITEKLKSYRSSDSGKE